MSHGAPSALLIALLACSAGGCDPGEAEGANADSPEAEARTPVEIHVARTVRFRREIEVTANVLPLRQVGVVARVGGRLQKILADEGDEVEANAIVAQLDPRDYQLGVRQAKAQLDAARANAQLAAIQAESASTQHDRMKALHQTAAISQSEMDKVADGHRMGIAGEAAAHAQVELAKVGLDAAQTQLADTAVRAPFAGVVIKRLLDEGTLCGPSDDGTIMVIADTSRVKVEGSVSELDLRDVRPGVPAVVRVDALPGVDLEGEVEIVSPMVDPMTRTSAVRVTLDNADRRLDTGMSARIAINLGEQEAIALPDDVLLRGEEGGRATVFVVDREGIAHRREVALGSRQGDLVEIREGLSEGERVVRGGQSVLIDGQPVSVVRGSAGEGG